MIEVNISFLKKLYNSDIIYHYTKASTAIDNILYSSQLRFSNTRLSIDPIESAKAHRGTVYYKNIGSENDDTADVNELHNFVDDLEGKFNLICFCQNTMGEDFASEHYYSSFDGHQELFGFTKLRMWDQYADKFTGVCLAFSKQKLLSLNESLNLFEGDVEYLSFQDLSLKKLGDLQGDHLKNVGKKEYKTQLESIINKSFLLKHIDYSCENEYRIGTFFDEQKCAAEKIKDKWVFDKNMMLNISGCIEAIFFSSYLNKKQKDDLLKYANDLDIEIIEMQWGHRSFIASDYRESQKLFNI